MNRDIYLKKMKNKYYKGGLLLSGGLVIVFPIMRTIGLIHQVHRGGALIKGPCVTYNTITARIEASPFNTKCLNAVDYILLFTAILSPLCAVAYYLKARVKDPVSRFVNDYKDAKTELEKLEEKLKKDLKEQNETKRTNEKKLIFKSEKKKLFALEILRLLPREQTYIKELSKKEEFFKTIADALMSRINDQEFLKTHK